MVKLVYCVRKRSDLSDEEFHDYWLNQHGPLVARLAPGLQPASGTCRATP